MSDIESYIITIKEKHGETAFKQLCLLYQHLLQSLPEATECISYGMPCFKLNNKPIVYFAANKKHIGFYPTAAPIEENKKLLTDFTYSKGSVHFRYELPLPKNLINLLIESRIKIISK